MQNKHERLRKAGFVRPLPPRHPRDRQELSVTQAGALAIFVVDKDVTRDMISSVRRNGDTLYIEALALLAEPKSKACKYPSADLIEACDVLTDRGVTIVESSTGRSSANKAEYRAMKKDALTAIAKGGRALPTKQARANGKKGGRTATIFTADTIEKARQIWKSRDVKTWADVKTKLPKGFTVHRAHKLWGPRG